MNSAILNDYGYTSEQGRPSDWYPFTFSARNSVLAKAPLSHGVFLLRAPESYPCKRKSSDIVYIGATFGSKGLRDQLEKYLRRRPAPLLNSNVRKLLRRNADLEVAWITTTSRAGAVSLKRDFLFWFKNQLGQLLRRIGACNQ